MRAPRYVHQFTDRHGRPRFYFRRPGFKRVKLPGLPWSPAFMEVYESAMDGDTGRDSQIAAKRSRPGTINALIVGYYNSVGFRTLSASTQATYRGILENFRVEHGDKNVSQLERKHVGKLIANKASTPAAANNLLRMLRTLMQFAIMENLRRDDPTRGIRPIKTGSMGFHTWTEEDITKFEGRHLVGTKARLAMTLMLYTGCRRSDVVLLGRQHIRNGFLTYTQIKNRKRKPVTLTIPIHSVLQHVIDKTPSDHLMFLVTSFGKPFTAAGFGNWMRDRCDEADLPECSSHGLRKAISRRLAEAGMSPHQIQAITGHATLKEVERYCRAASQKLMAARAMQSLTMTEDDAEPALLTDQRQHKS